MMTPALLPQPLHFPLPPQLEAAQPPEARGLARDGVRLMVSHYLTDQITHTHFRDIGRHLVAGDVLVLNTSGTLGAAVEAQGSDGTRLELHLSTHLGKNLWSVELRLPGEHGSTPFRDAVAGETIRLPGASTATLIRPYLGDATPSVAVLSPRLWVAALALPEPWLRYLRRYGFPIRYGYVREEWPLAYYQTVYARQPGSAEMPSAGRAFTCELLERLKEQGVEVAELVLHTGVSSLEDHEPPYPERYRVPPETARVVNEARRQGRRVIAVGTTVVRALETVTDIGGRVSAGAGWTGLVVTPERGIRAITGLLTGLHEPSASHLAMLEALAGRRHLEAAYGEALRQRYLWHEFGDLHLILP